MNMTKVITEAKTGDKVYHLRLIWKSRQSSLMLYEEEESRRTPSPALLCLLEMSLAMTERKKAWEQRGEEEEEEKGEITAAACCLNELRTSGFIFWFISFLSYLSLVHTFQYVPPILSVSKIEQEKKN